MRRIVILVLLLLPLLLAGCSGTIDSGEITVTAALFPEYDWTRQILGEDSPIRLTLLIGNGTDPHSFQPTAGDILTVINSDLVIYGGGESEEWLRDALEAGHKSPDNVLELMPLLHDRLLNAAYLEGMQTRVEEDEADEHFWLSLQNAKICCQSIAEQLCRLDPDRKALYLSNLSRLLDDLDALDADYRTTISVSRTDTILVADRFPFCYLTNDYALKSYAAFPGCSSESGASFHTILFLSEKMKEYELTAVLIPDGSDGRIARTLANNAGLPEEAVLTLDSMQSISLKQAMNTNYLTIMRQNLDILRTALQ